MGKRQRKKIKAKEKENGNNKQPTWKILKVRRRTPVVQDIY